MRWALEAALNAIEYIKSKTFIDLETGGFRKTHCLRGHLYTPANTLKAPTRSCRACHYERLRKKRADLRAAQDSPKKETGDVNLEA